MVDVTSAPSDVIFYEDLRVLWTGQRYREVWPSVDMTIEERVNSIVRFCGLCGIALYVARKGDDRYLLYALTAIAIVTMSYRFSKQRENFDATPYKPYWYGEPENVSADEGKRLCQPPTQSNPFGNVLLTDISGNPDRPPACPYDEVKSDIKRTFDDQQYRDIDDVYSHAGRSFHTMPSTTVPSDQNAFISFCYRDLIESKKNDSRSVNPW